MSYLVGKYHRYFGLSRTELGEYPKDWIALGSEWRYRGEIGPRKDFHSDPELSRDMCTVFCKKVGNEFLCSQFELLKLHRMISITESICKLIQKS